MSGCVAAVLAGAGGGVKPPARSAHRHQPTAFLAILDGASLDLRPGDLRRQGGVVSALRRRAAALQPRRSLGATASVPGDAVFREGGRALHRAHSGGDGMESLSWLRLQVLLASWRRAIASRRRREAFVRARLLDSRPSHAPRRHACHVAPCGWKTPGRTVAPLTGSERRRSRLRHALCASVRLDERPAGWPGEAHGLQRGVMSCLPVQGKSTSRGFCGRRFPRTGAAAGGVASASAPFPSWADGGGAPLL